MKFGNRSIRSRQAIAKFSLMHNPKSLTQIPTIISPELFSDRKDLYIVKKITYRHISP